MIAADLDFWLGVDDGGSAVVGSLLGSVSADATAASFQPSILLNWRKFWEKGDSYKDYTRSEATTYLFVCLSVSRENDIVIFNI